MTKKTFLFFMTCLLSFELTAQGILKIENSPLNLKNLIADNETQSYTFNIKNEGNQPIIIKRVTPMSALLNASWSKEPLLPGKTSTIKIIYTSSRFQKNFDYRILVHSNAKNASQEIQLYGNLVDNPDKPALLYKYTLSGIKFQVSNINLGKLYTWQKTTDTIYYFNTRKKPVSLSIDNQPNYIHIDFIPKKVAPNQRGKMILTYDASLKEDYGYCYEHLIININGSKDMRNRLTLTANIYEDFSRLSTQELKDAPIATIEKTTVNFGNIHKGEKTNCDFILKNTGKNPLIIRKTKTTCGCTAVSLKNKILQSGQSTIIRIIFDSTGKSGMQYKTVSVITNDPKNPEITLNIEGNIKTI